jgi:hypothetical protein
MKYLQLIIIVCLVYTNFPACRARKANTSSKNKMSVSRIELRENSGPVSPAYQYNTLITISAGADSSSLTIDCQHRAAFEGGKPKTDVNYQRPLTAEETQNLIKILQEVKADSWKDTPLPEATKKLIGISFNRLAVTMVGKEKITYEYTLADLNTNKDAPEPKLITYLKTFIKAAK